MTNCLVRTQVRRCALRQSDVFQTSYDLAYPAIWVEDILIAEIINGEGPKKRPGNPSIR